MPNKGREFIWGHQQRANAVIPQKAEPAKSQPWPLVLLPLKLLAQPGDKGLGDIVDRTVGPLGGEAFKAWYLRVFGESCGVRCHAGQLEPTLAIVI